MIDESLVADIVRARSQPQSQDVTSFDSGAVFMVKALFYLVTAVAFLVFCLWLGKRSFTGSYFLIAVLTFAGTAELLGDSRVDHNPAELRQELRWLLDMVLRWALVGACVALVLYLSGLRVSPTDRALAAWFVFTPIVLWGGTIGMRQILLYAGVKHTPRRAVIVGANKQGLLLGRKILEQSLMQVNLLGFFDDRPMDYLPRLGEARLGRLGDVPDFVRKHRVNVVYVTLPITPRPGLAELLRGLRDTVASVYFVPDCMRSATFKRASMCCTACRCSRSTSRRSSACGRWQSVPATSYSRRAPLSWLSPVFAVAVAIGVKLSSPGPVIFRQRRYGLDGREIMVYKFRSMTVTEDGAGSYTQVTRDDSRVTPFGAFIRRTSLDELPQLFNVLEGSMSLVGPRPHAIAVNEHYRALIPSYMLRHKVKPGITGWAQVNGFRGGDDLRTMRSRIECDLRIPEELVDRLRPANNASNLLAHLGRPRCVLTGLSVIRLSPLRSRRGSSSPLS